MAYTRFPAFGDSWMFLFKRSALRFKTLFVIFFLQSLEVDEEEILNEVPYLN